MLLWLALRRGRRWRGLALGQALVLGWLLALRGRWPLVRRLRWLALRLLRRRLRRRLVLGRVLTCGWWLALAAPSALVAAIAAAAAAFAGASAAPGPATATGAATAATGRLLKRINFALHKVPIELAVGIVRAKL